MRLLFQLLFCFTFTNLYSQGINSFLVSKGETPSFINLENHFIQRKPVDFKAGFMDRSSDLPFVISDIANSGKILFGDTISTFVQSILNSVVDREDDYKVFIVKSNQVVTFSSQDKNIFVSTGLISQISTPYELAFFLCREIEINDNRIINELNFSKTNLVTYEDKIKFITTYSLATEVKIDSLAIIRYINHSLPTDGINDCMNIMLYDHLPFDQLRFPNDYFNSEQYYIPPSFFDYYEGKDGLVIKKPESFRVKESNFKLRYQKIKGIIAAKGSGLVVDLNLDNGFDFAVKLSKYEYVKQNLLQCNYANAIYSIFLLESIDGESEFLDNLKAHAWLGHVGQKLGNVNPRKNSSLQSVEAESSRFHYSLRMLNQNGVASLSLRLLYDFKNKYRNDKFDLFWEKLIKNLSKNKQ